MSFQTPPHIQPISTHFTLLLLKKKVTIFVMSFQTAPHIQHISTQTTL